MRKDVMKSGLDRIRMVSRVAGACFGLLLSALAVNAADWYVDKNAVGSNAGTSWANAWNSFASINWTSINPGDNLWISGGPTASTKQYIQTLFVQKSGTSGARITIGVKADDPLHNGTVVIDGSNYIDANGKNYITYTGNVGGQQKFRIQNQFNDSNPNFGNAVLADSSIGVKFDSMSFSNVNNALKLDNASSFWVTNVFMRQMRGDSMIKANGAFGAGWDGNKIENCDMEVVVNSIDGGGPDGIQTGNNITIRNNTFRVRRITGFYTSNQHPDMIQAPGAFLDIYNNDFINVGDSCI